MRVSSAPGVGKFGSILPLMIHKKRTCQPLPQGNSLDRWLGRKDGGGGGGARPRWFVHSPLETHAGPGLSSMLDSAAEISGL